MIPTYPSSGSENNSWAVATEKGSIKFIFGIPAEYSFLVPKYSLSLNQELTSYANLVTLVQLCIIVLGDKNPVSYDFGIS